MDGAQWYIIGSIVSIALFFAGFLLGRRSNRASGVSVPPSPEVLIKIEERIRKHEKLKENGEAINETTSDLVNSVNDLLNAGSTSSP